MNQNTQCSTTAASQDAGKRAWIYIRIPHNHEPRFDSLEKDLRAYAGEQEFSLMGFSIDFNSRNGGRGMVQMLQAAKEDAFDVLLIRSLDQLNTTLLMSLDIMTCLDNQGIQIWSPGRGRYDVKKMSAAYDLDKYLDDLEDRRYARELRECYMGDCEPGDYDDDDYGDDYHPEAWETAMIRDAERW